MPSASLGLPPFKCWTEVLPLNLSLLNQLVCLGSTIRFLHSASLVAPPLCLSSAGVLGIVLDSPSLPGKQLYQPHYLPNPTFNILKKYVLHIFSLCLRKALY